jgi:phage shock protein PspC (stress-responsive transcriptional regulator)
MYCRECGKEIGAEDCFCSLCGAAQRVTWARATGRSLVRPRAGRKIAGVALGFARYLELDPALLRILWVLLIVLSGGIGLFVYIAAWIIMPEEECLPAPAVSPAVPSAAGQGT